LLLQPYQTKTEGEVPVKNVLSSKLPAWTNGY
jgi:hypothetical protein